MATQDTAIREIIRSNVESLEEMNIRTFTKWINSKLGGKEPVVKDLMTDLQDGRVLLSLLEVLLKVKLPSEKGKLKFHKLNNVNKALKELEDRGLKLHGITNAAIVDGNRISILGLVWMIILHFQVQGVVFEEEQNDQDPSPKKKSSASQAEVEALLIKWAQEVLKEFSDVVKALERDINAPQDTFASLNETGQVVMADLAPGEVLTALQSKLDDMNDRWNSLNARSVDVGDKLDGGATEWRQLFLDLQEIVDWIERAIQQLEAQKPVGSDIETVTVQNDTHQTFKNKINMQRLVIDRALESGKRHLENYDTLHPASPSRTHLAENFRSQLSVIRDRWPTLARSSDAWQKTLDEALRLLNLLETNMRDLDGKLHETENYSNQSKPVSIDIVQDQSENMKPSERSGSRMTPGSSTGSMRRPGYHGESTASESDNEGDRKPLVGGGDRGVRDPELRDVMDKINTSFPHDRGTYEDTSKQPLMDEER